MRFRLLAAVVIGGLLSIMGPKLSTPGETKAGEPFVFTPPEGFVSAGEAGDGGGTVPGGKQAWIHPAGALTGYVSRVFVVHTPTRAAVDHAELERLSKGMPAMFEESKVAWVHVRSEVRTRADGSRIGMIEGEGEQKGVKLRTLQLVFPDDEGTSLVTAMYPLKVAPEWGPRFDVSIASAKGVTRRAPPQPRWVNAAWGAGGFLVAYVALGLLRKKDEEAKGEPEKKPEKKPEKIEPEPAEKEDA